MNESLQQHLDSLARDECYRVDAVLKEGRYERTERVFFVGANGAEQGPYVRKVFEAESGLGGRVRAGAGCAASGTTVPVPAAHHRLLFVG